MPMSQSNLLAARRWSRCPCTPPSEITPMRCAAPPLALSLAAKSKIAGFWKKVLSSIARSICPKSIATTRPAPILVWPTSELPICPLGRPASGPWVIRCAFGQCAIRRSKFGVCARAGALPCLVSLKPHPSKIQSTTGLVMTSSFSVRLCLPDRWRYSTVFARALFGKTRL